MRGAFGTEFGRDTVSVVAAVGIALAIAGCSSGVSRFDYPSYSLSEDEAVADPSTTASLQNPKSYNYYGDSSGSGRIARSTPPPQTTAAYDTSKPRYYGAPRAARPSAPPPVAQASGPRIKVQKGDTLSGLSQRYGVPIDSIQSANNLADGRLREGQVLIMPGAKVAAAPKPAPRMPVATPQPPAQAVAQAPAAPAPNGARKVKTTTIAAPGASTPSQTTQSTTKAAPKVASKTPQRVTSTSQLPKPEPMTGNSFRWPVKGRVISGFGTKPDGGHNDGINISVPQGTPVKAAENGVVAYSGSELKGYGNLVLIRHANNWVSAYANNEELMVKRGDKVQRGQVIAKAGTTGSVSQPQVHFELRKGSRPVDPTKYMSSMAAQAN